MKSIASLALTIATLTTAVAATRPSILAQFESSYNQTEIMSEFKFMSKLIYSTYNGFVRGLYREHQRNVINENCLGEWATKNLTYLEKVWEKVNDFEILDIPYEDAIEAAKDAVNLIYRNRDACDVQHIVKDLVNFCPDEDCLDNIEVVKNVKANLLVLIAKVEPVFDYFFNPESLDAASDEEVIRMGDTFGDAYGTVISYVLGFDKRYLAPKMLY